MMIVRGINQNQGAEPEDMISLRVWADPHRVITFGGKPLVPAEVESPYIIRVAIALLMLASSIDGPPSRIKKATPIRRAHPRFVENIGTLGARIDWVEED